MVVAASEGILYLIWSSRRTSGSYANRPILKDKKASEEPPEVVVEEEAKTSAHATKEPLRKRKRK